MSQRHLAAEIIHVTLTTLYKNSTAPQLL